MALDVSANGLLLPYNGDYHTTLLSVLKDLLDNIRSHDHEPARPCPGQLTRCPAVKHAIFTETALQNMCTLHLVRACLDLVSPDSVKTQWDCRGYLA